MNSPFRLAFALAILVPAMIASNAIVVGQNIDWQTNIEQASKTAGTEGKVVLLHFTADWCRPCKSLETFVFSHSRVQNAFASNVIGVKVDVDKFPDLAREYGVSSVPFDVAITPQGRIVSKRSSPRDSSTYARMVEGLSKTINGLENGNPALTQKLNELKDVMSTNTQFAEHKSFVPETPSHSVPTLSSKSMDLQRRSRISNPYAVATLKSEKSEPQVFHNDFFADKSSTNQSANQPLNQSPVAIAPYTSASVSLESDVTKSPHRSNTANLAIATKAMPMTKSNPFAFNQPPVTRQATHLPDLEQEDQLKMTAPHAGESANQKILASAKLKVPPVNNVNNDLSAIANSFQASLAQPSVPGRVDFSRPDNMKTLDATANLKVGSRSDMTPEMVERLFEAADEKKTKRPLQALANAKLLIPNFNKREPVQQQAVHDGVSQDQKPIANPTIPPARSSSQSTAKIGNRTLPENVALNGKCPISLMSEGAWVDGDLKWGCLHRERVYLFASESKFRKFQSDPDAFSPLLAGFDPVVFKRSGDLVDGAEEHGVFMGQAPNQRVVLFNSAETRAEFQANPRVYIETIRQAMRSSETSSSKLLRR